MWQTAINTVMAAAVAALVAVVVAFVKAFGDAAVAYIKRKQDALVAKIGADTYQQDLAVARSVWGAVDEYFRITPTVTKTIAAAQAKFAEMIQRAIPGITDDEIEQLRQAVAGEVNKGRAALTASSTPQAVPSESGAVAPGTTSAV